VWGFPGGVNTRNVTKPNAVDDVGFFDRSRRKRFDYDWVGVLAVLHTLEVISRILASQRASIRWIRLPEKSRSTAVLASGESVGRRTLGENDQLGGIPVPQAKSVTVGRENKLNELWCVVQARLYSRCVLSAYWSS